MAQNLIVVLPELVLALLSVVVLLIDIFSESRSRLRQTAGLAMMAVVLTLAVCIALWGKNLSGYNGIVRLDSMGLLLSMVCLVSAGATILLASDYLRQIGSEKTEFFLLILLSTVGMMVMVKAGELLTLFIGLETLSIPLYVLAGFRRQEPRSQEAALKYFLMGAFASGFLLYGIALTYAATGTTIFSELRHSTSTEAIAGSPILLAGLGLMLVGFAFKLALVPFHMWAPDVYEGSPTPVTAFMSTGVKVAAFGALVRLLGGGLASLQEGWGTALWMLAALSILFGNILALKQNNLKRLLAYSSIAHAGYILVGVVAYHSLPTAFGPWAVSYYLAAYVVMNLGAFGVLILVQSRPGGAEKLEDLRGLSQSHPLVALCMTFFLLSLAGMPPFWGFVAKFYVFGAAIQAGRYYLAIIGVLGSLISIFYYLRIIVEMYMSEPTEPEPKLSSSLAVRVTVGAAALLTLLGGLFSSGLADAARDAIRMLITP